jgi:hypothetical protein
MGMEEYARCDRELVGGLVAEDTVVGVVSSRWFTRYTNHRRYPLNKSLFYGFFYLSCSKLDDGRL